MGATREFHVETTGERLDRFLADRSPDLSRAYLQKLIADGQVTVNRRLAKASQRLRTGDHVQVEVPPPAPLGLTPEPVPYQIIYEDEHLIVVDKPAGVVVHPSPGHAGGTLVHGLLADERRLAGIGGTLRPGIVHRLDKDTSGLMVVAKDDLALADLQRQFKARTVEKRYLALVAGHPRPAEATVEAPVGRDPRQPRRMAVVENGRPARTRYRVLRELKGHSLIEAIPETGRTHQIRVHLAAIGHPIAGDPAYGVPLPGLGRQFLHAAHLAFRLPGSDRRVAFDSPLPADLAAALDSVGSGQ